MLGRVACLPAGSEPLLNGASRCKGLRAPALPFLGTAKLLWAWRAGEREAQAGSPLASKAGVLSAAAPGEAYPSLRSLSLVTPATTQEQPHRRLSDLLMRERARREREREQRLVKGDLMGGWLGEGREAGCAW